MEPVHVFKKELFASIYAMTAGLNTFSLLSTRRLAEKFIDEAGNPDEQTRIESSYSTHVLTWSLEVIRGH